MSVLKIEDPSHIELPVEVSERLGLKRGDVIVITIEQHRVIVEKRASSPIDASFGLWRDLPSSPDYLNVLRNEWDDRLDEQLPDE
jgi:bifunctional DNA-binding transcriptional regulator/antitoxin component of YhaV-PrlF toxin-antitoxin module